MRPFLTPKWILSHLFVATMVVVMTILGFWQLDRLDERKARNVDVRAAMEAAPQPVETVLAAAAAGEEPLDHTAVVVAGEYLDDHQFLVANRTFESQAGSWLATPVQLDDGRVVVVARGWVPRLWTAGQDVRSAEPPTGSMEVLGRLNRSVDDGRIGSGDTAVLPELSRLDLDRVEELTGLEVEPFWVQLEQQAPPLGDLPIPVPRPGLDEGPHLSYAFQWFFFSASTIVAYGLILRRRRKELDLDEGNVDEGDLDAGTLA